MAFARNDYDQDFYSRDERSDYGVCLQKRTDHFFVVAAKIMGHEFKDDDLSDVVNPFESELTFEGESQQAAYKAYNKIKQLSELYISSPEGFQNIITLVATLLKQGDFIEKEKDFLEAEWLANCIPRVPLETVVPLQLEDHIPIAQKRISTPITAFTEKQEEEWLRILNEEASKRPKWFNDLSKVVQQELINKVEEWNNLPRENSPNLGDYLGSLSVTCRRIPGLSNAFVETVKTYIENDEEKENEPVVTHKIRIGNLVPYEMKNEDERIEQTKQNILQLARFVNKNKDKFSPDEQDTISIEIHSLVASFGGKYLKEGEIYVDLVTAIEELYLDGRLANNISLSVFNQSINTFQSLDAFMGQDSRVEFDEDIRGKLSGMQQGALNEMERISTASEKIKNAFSRSGVNHATYRAALRQIALTGKGLLRVGGCKSGKDREEAVSIHAAALQAYYAAYKEFPEAPTTGSAGKGWGKYINIAAKIFLSKHGAVIADYNACGAYGIKNPRALLGSAVYERAQEIYIQKAAEIQTKKDLPNGWDGWKAAKLNKPELNLTIKHVELFDTDEFQEYLKVRAQLVDYCNGKPLYEPFGKNILQEADNLLFASPSKISKKDLELITLSIRTAYFLAIEDVGSSKISDLKINLKDNCDKLERNFANKKFVASLKIFAVASLLITAGIALAVVTGGAGLFPAILAIKGLSAAVGLGVGLGAASLAAGGGFYKHKQVGKSHKQGLSAALRKFSFSKNEN